MENISDLIQLLSNNKKEDKVEIPKELADQYPYGKFPIRYTKLGQEEIRKQSESRFSYNDEKIEEKKEDSNLDLKTILPIIQLMTSSKKNPKDMMKILTKILFKDNPNYEKLFSSLTNMKSQEVKSEDFPDTNKVTINNLKRVH